MLSTDCNHVDLVHILVLYFSERKRTANRSVKKGVCSVETKNIYDSVSSDFQSWEVMGNLNRQFILSLICAAGHPPTRSVNRVSSNFCRGYLPVQMEGIKQAFLYRQSQTLRNRLAVQPKLRFITPPELRRFFCPIRFIIHNH